MFSRPTAVRDAGIARFERWLNKTAHRKSPSQSGFELTSSAPSVAPVSRNRNDSIR